MDSVAFCAVVLVLPVFPVPFPPLPQTLSRKAMTLAVAKNGAIALTMAWMGVNYLHLVNAKTGSSELVLVQGPVVKLQERNERYLGTIREVTLRYEGQDFRIDVTEEEYRKLRVGDTYGRECYRGGLGWYWRPGRNYWK